MPEARENVIAVTAKAAPIAISQPVRASSRRSRVETASAIAATAANPRNQPA